MSGRRRGRPSVGQRVPLGLRVTPEMKARLDAAAAQSGRSQSQEAEFRLEKSFDREDLLPEVLATAFPKPIAGLLLAIGLVMTNAGEHDHWSRTDITATSGDGWLNDPMAFEQAMRAAWALLSSARPIGSIAKSNDSLGVKIAQGMIDAIHRDPSPDDPFGPRHLNAIREMLRPISERLAARAQARKNPYALALAVALASQGLEDHRKDNGILCSPDEVAKILEAHLKEFLVPDWQQRGWEQADEGEHNQAGAEELAAEIRRRA